MSEAFERCDLLVAVEVDAPDSGGVIPLPAPLDRRGAEEIGIRLAADLGSIAPGAQQLGFSLAGALYDQTQLLQPGFPIFSELATFYRKSLRGGSFEARILTLGASDDGMPEPALEPTSLGLVGPLLLMPIALCGPAERIAPMSNDLETLLIEQGQLSPASALALQQAFDLRIAHARLMTINDLSAMLRLQLEHVGLPQLWDLLDAALFAPAKPAWASTELGNRAIWVDQGIDLLFQTFDRWSQGPERGNLDGEELAEHYQHYLRIQRQLGLSLRAHGLDTRLYPVSDLPADLDAWLARRTAEQPLAGAVVTEVSRDGPDEGPARITEHTSGDLGTIAYTFERVDAEGSVLRRVNYYPLRPECIAEIQAELRAMIGPSAECAWPGQLCFDARTRELVGDPSLNEAPSQWH